MIIVKRTELMIARKLELDWVVLDDEQHKTIGYFYEERDAIIAARALNKLQKSASRKP